MVFDPEDNIFEHRVNNTVFEVAEGEDEGDLLFSISSRTDFAEVEFDGRLLYEVLHEKYGK